jgi:hypothetical protein
MEEHEKGLTKRIEQGGIQGIERRLAGFRDELSLHVVVDLSCVYGAMRAANVLMMLLFQGATQSTQR